MREKLLLLRAFFKMEFITFRRYWMNSLGGMLTLYVIFLVLFGGYQGLRSLGGVEGDPAEVIVVGYVLWFFMLSTYQDVWYTIRTEAQQGTLEQLYMSIHPFGWIMGAKVVARFFINLLLVAILLGAALFTTGVTLNLDLLSLMPVLIGTLLSSLGIGFLIGGITLMFKRIDSYTQMVQFILIALVALPADRVLWMRLLPGSYGATLIRNILVDGATLWGLGVGNLAMLFAIGLLHLAVGYGVYTLCEKKAMFLGMLGHY